MQLCVIGVTSHLCRYLADVTSGVLYKLS
jgi:hypothetical protein